MGKPKYIETPEKLWQYFLSYKTEIKENPSHCDREYFYINIDANIVTIEDKEELEKLGFFVDSEYDGHGFGSFRYGSY